MLYGKNGHVALQHPVYLIAICYVYTHVIAQIILAIMQLHGLI